MARSRRRPWRAFGCLALVLVLAVAGLVGWTMLRNAEIVPPLPGAQRCVATASGHSVVLDLNQAHFAAIIAARSVARGLPPRAASIALATAYQESGIRNLSYGDRDSVGLFQQRPSQGWGTAQQLTDPVYASDKFYAALVRIRDWQTQDITQVAQQIQRSGHPEAYRSHEADGRTLASVLTGQSIAAISCLERRGRPGDADGLARLIHSALGGTADRSGSTLTVRPATSGLAWAYGQFVIANAAEYGVASVQVTDQVWTSGSTELGTWERASASPTPAATSDRTVVITVRG